MTSAYAELRPKQAAQHADDRGLALSVRPEETEDRIVANGKRNMIHRREMAEALGQLFTFNHGFGGHGLERLQDCKCGLYFITASNLPPTILPANPKYPHVPKMFVVVI